MPDHFLVSGSMSEREIHNKRDKEPEFRDALHENMLRVWR